MFCERECDFAQALVVTAKIRITPIDDSCDKAGYFSSIEVFRASRCPMSRFLLTPNVLANWRAQLSVGSGWQASRSGVLVRTYAKCWR